MMILQCVVIYSFLMTSIVTTRFLINAETNDGLQKLKTICKNDPACIKKLAALSKKLPALLLTLLQKNKEEKKNEVHHHHSLKRSLIDSGKKYGGCGGSNDEFKGNMEPDLMLMLLRHIRKMYENEELIDEKK